MIKLNDKTREQYNNIVLKLLHDDDIIQFRSAFLELHPSDQIDIFITLNKEERDRFYTFISPKEMAEIYGGLYFDKQKIYLEEMNESYASDMFNNMFTDEVVHFLSEIPSDKANLILAKMNKAKAKKIQSILSYQKETAGAVMTKELISINSTESVADVLDMLRDKAPDAEIVYYLYVVNAERKLVGVVSLRDLIVADPKEVINDIMSKRVVSVPEDMDQED